MNVGVTTSYQYSVKIMNPQRKTSFVVKKLSVSRNFRTREDVMDEQSKELDTSLEEISYVSPGHGLRGKHTTMSTDRDVLKIEYHSKRVKCVFLVSVPY